MTSSLATEGCKDTPEHPQMTPPYLTNHWADLQEILFGYADKDKQWLPTAHHGVTRTVADRGGGV